MLRSTFTGETMIFKNDKGFYSTSISKKIRNADGTDGGYDNAYLNVNFTKKVDIPNQTKINITNGWLSFNKFKDKEGNNRTTFNIVVSDFTPVDNPNVIGAQKVAQNTAKPSEDFGISDNDDLPF